MMRKFAFYGSIAAMFVGGVVLGQQPTQPQPQQTQGQQPRTNNTAVPQQQAHMQSQNEIIANCLALDNQAEVVIARFALQKSQNKDVQEFARLMDEDHQKFLSKLQQASTTGARFNLASSNVDLTRPSGNTPVQDQPNPGQDQPNPRQDQPNPRQEQPNPRQDQLPNPGTGDQRAMSNVSGALQLQREVAQQCLADTKQFLSEKEGAEFDKCYIGLQAMLHAGMKSKLTVFNKHATGELKNVIATEMQTVEKHLQHAEKIKGELEGADNKARRGE